MTQLVRPSQSGQITIPVEFRKKLDITEDTFLQVTIADGELRLPVVGVGTSQLPG